MGVIKILGNALQLSGTGTTIPDMNGIGAQYVLIQHTGSGNNYIIQQTGIGDTIGTVYIPSESFLIIKKQRTDILKVDGGNDIYATSVVYQG